MPASDPFPFTTEPGGTMTEPSARWILTFDATCRTCREISESVARACDGRLEVLPLADADVRRWREHALGPEAAWAPTLLRVGDGVRAWTGPRIAAPLVRRLGAAATVRVLSALGRLSRRANGRADELPSAGEPSRSVMGRAQFLRLGAGAGVAAGLILTGRTPAFAAKEKQSAQAWVQAHRNDLPQRYAEVIRYPESYRKEIFHASSPKVRSRLWTEHIENYRAKAAHLTPGQRDVIERALRLVRSESTFSGDGAVRPRLRDLKRAGIREFGHDEAYALLAVLGRATPRTALRDDYDCECNTTDVWCGGGSCKPSCNEVPNCGTAWMEPCNGKCYDN